MTTSAINYYVFDTIQLIDGDYIATKDGKTYDVYPMEGEMEADLENEGLAKCDAPGTETFVVWEADIDF